jgi:hypothetical protein
VRIEANAVDPSDEYRMRHLSEPVDQAMQAFKDLTEQFSSIESMSIESILRDDDPDEGAAYPMVMSVRAQRVAVEQLLHLVRMEQTLNRMSDKPETKRLYADTVELHRDDEA